MNDDVYIGKVGDFSYFPAPIKIEGERFFLTQSDGEFKLLLNDCPHMGGQVDISGEGFVCPAHGWRYDSSGVGINPRGQSLKQIPILHRDDGLYVLKEYLPRSRAKRDSTRSTSQPDVDISLLAHACVLFSTETTRLLIDPWLDGPAFLGAWAPYPPPQTGPEALNPTDILITHEHSDHMHEQTLGHFPRSVNIWFPDFPNQRMQSMLRDMGFTNLYPMLFGQRYELAEDIAVTCFEPASLWNDSINLIELAGFNVLNLNDAGVNFRIAGQMPPIDMLMSGFSTGASGFPATWTHLSEESKREHYENAAAGILRMLRQAVDVYGAKFLLPFASYFTLWYPQQRKFAELLYRNTHDEMSGALDGTSCEVLDILPGEVWNIRTSGWKQRIPAEQRAVIFTSEEIERYRDSLIDRGWLKQVHLQADIDRARVHEYFMRLNRVPEILFSEELDFRVQVLDGFEGEQLFALDYRIEAGELKPVQHGPDWQQELVIGIPSGILADIIDNELSWDEAHGGYWCTLSRNPDIYHPEFWRLLQAPYYCRKPAKEALDKDERAISRTTGMQTVMERWPHTTSVLSRYGLHCTTCGKAYRETLEQGARFHGLTDQQISRLIDELNVVCQ